LLRWTGQPRLALEAALIRAVGERAARAAGSTGRGGVGETGAQPDGHPRAPRPAEHGPPRDALPVEGPVEREGASREAPAGGSASRREEGDSAEPPAGPAPVVPSEGAGPMAAAREGTAAGGAEGAPAAVLAGQWQAFLRSLRRRREWTALHALLRAAGRPRAVGDVLELPFAQPGMARTAEVKVPQLRQAIEAFLGAPVPVRVVVEAAGAGGRDGSDGSHQTESPPTSASSGPSPRLAAAERHRQASAAGASREVEARRPEERNQGGGPGDRLVDRNEAGGATGATPRDRVGRQEPSPPPPTSGPAAEGAATPGPRASGDRDDGSRGEAAPTASAATAPGGVGARAPQPGGDGPGPSPPAASAGKAHDTQEVTPEAADDETPGGVVAVHRRPEPDPPDLDDVQKAAWELFGGQWIPVKEEWRRELRPLGQHGQDAETA
ncbi:MAG TPA: DNA polymerase III subunit gamma/tau, partial [Thermaerobacter sp.]